MNLKAALLLFLVLFASTVTIVATVSSIPVSLPVGVTETVIHNDSGLVKPTGDPILDPVFPG